MKPQHTAAFLLALNIVCMIFISFTRSPEQKFDKITVREFELVGDDGMRRANIKVEPSGEVVFRMMDKTGTIRVKLGANEDGSGLVLLDNSTEPAIHALAKKEGGKVSLLKEGKKREL